MIHKKVKVLYVCESVIVAYMCFEPVIKTEYINNGFRIFTENIKTDCNKCDTTIVVNLIKQKNGTFYIENKH